MDDLYFIFDGVNSKSKGIKLQRPIEISPPVPNVTSIVIPGRNGVLHHWDGSYRNRTAIADCYHYSTDMENALVSDNRFFLHWSQEYKRLVCNNDQNHFWLARPKSGIAEQVRKGVLNPFTVEFDLKPEKYRLDGQTVIEVTDSATFTNPTSNVAKPYIEVTGTGDLILMVNQETCYLTGLTENQTIRIDTESGNSNNNSKVKFNGNLYFNTTQNIVTITGNGTAKVTARWWDL